MKIYKNFKKMKVNNNNNNLILIFNKIIQVLLQIQVNKNKVLHMTQNFIWMINN